MKTSLRKDSELFGIVGGITISHETVRRNIPEIPEGRFESEGYFVYDEQHVYIDGIERYRALLKDSKTGNFVEEILDYLKEEMLARFFIRATSCFTVPEVIFITSDGYHYESVLETVASGMCNMGNNMESVIKLTDGKNEGEIVGIIMDKVMKSYLISLTLLRNT
ncbi:MAG: hypothetical protein ACYDCP_09630 [Thermoplasmataceae archaeon]